MFVLKYMLVLHRSQVETDWHSRHPLRHITQVEVLAFKKAFEAQVRHRPLFDGWQVAQLVLHATQVLAETP